MLKSNAEVFRTRQSVSDLSQIVTRNGTVLNRLSDTQAGQDALLGVCNSGFRLPQPDIHHVHTRLLLVAALPDDDFHGFTVATAILLANRLSVENKVDDLYWNWDAFRSHYLLGEAQISAALMNGYKCLADLGRVTLGAGPKDKDCLTQSKGSVLNALDAREDALLIEAIADDAQASEAGALWQQETAQDTPPRRLAAFRYLYERPLSMAPPDPNTANLIAWA